MLTFTFQYGQIYYREVAFLKVSRGKFTFQYGQIYYRNNDQAIPSNKNNLHSNMVRFIIIKPEKYYIESFKFTFQYGQIYYTNISNIFDLIDAIYIPIWLDLLC